MRQNSWAPYVTELLHTKVACFAAIIGSSRICEPVIEAGVYTQLYPDTRAPATSWNITIVVSTCRRLPVHIQSYTSSDGRVFCCCC